MTTTPIEIEKLENLEDLGMLVKGDAVEMTDVREIISPIWKKIGAFHEGNRLGHYVFLFPAFVREEYIVKVGVRRSFSRVDNGRLLYDGDRCSARAISQNDLEYADLNKTLQMASLR